MLKVATVSPNEPYREYKDVERVYSGSTEIDKILDKNGNVLFAVNKEVEGTPALTYKGKEETNLKNYRIYGNTVDGESVGDKTGNLFDKDDPDVLDGYEIRETNIVVRQSYFVTNFISVNAETSYITNDGTIDGFGSGVLEYDSSKQLIRRNPNSSYNGFTTTNTTAYIKLNGKIESKDTCMLVKGNTVPSIYEPYGYKVPVTVEGKNLFDENSLISPISDFTWYFDDEHYLLATDTSRDNRGWRYSNSQFRIALSAGTYTLRLSGVGAISRYSEIYVFKSNNDVIYSENITGKTNIVITFTLNTPETIGIEVKLYEGKYRIMLVEGSTALPYEPYHAPVTTPIYLPEPIKMVGDEAEYVDYKEQKQHRVRKNLLQNTRSSQTKNGVTFTVNMDGSVTSNGQASDVAIFPIPIQLATGMFIINGCPKNGDAATYSVDLRNPSNGYVIGGRDAGEGFLFTAATDTTANYSIRIEPGYTCDNLTFYPMIRKADIEDDTYEPYIENTEVDVTLPVISTLAGTNTLTVGTEVQPSNVYLKGRIKEVS